MSVKGSAISRRRSKSARRRSGQRLHAVLLHSADICRFPLTVEDRLVRSVSAKVERERPTHIFGGEAPQPTPEVHGGALNSLPLSAFSSASRFLASRPMAALWVALAFRDGCRPGRGAVLMGNRAGRCSRGRRCHRCPAAAPMVAAALAIGSRKPVFHRKSLQ